MKVHDCAQRSETWYAVRLGKLTASRVGEAFAKIKSGEAASRRNLRMQLVLERLTGKSQENGYQSDDMRRGIELEPDALGAYEAETGLLVESVGFCEHDSLLTGCSPDGLVSGDGLLDAKCPKAANHYDFIRNGPSLEYRLQLTHDLWITGRAWGDSVSFHPDFPPALRLKVVRLFAKDLDLSAHERQVRAFLDEVDREVEAIGALAGAVA